MKKVILAILAWYFVILHGGNSPAQIGPFATQAACENYRTQQIETQSFSSAPCFSSTSKQ